MRSRLLVLYKCNGCFSLQTAGPLYLGFFLEFRRPARTSSSLAGASVLVRYQSPFAFC